MPGTEGACAGTRRRSAVSTTSGQGKRRRGRRKRMRWWGTRTWTGPRSGGEDRASPRRAQQVAWSCNFVNEMNESLAQEIPTASNFEHVVRVRHLFFMEENCNRFVTGVGPNSKPLRALHQKFVRPKSTDWSEPRMSSSVAYEPGVRSVSLH